MFIKLGLCKVAKLKVVHMANKMFSRDNNFKILIKIKPSATSICYCDGQENMVLTYDLKLIFGLRFTIQDGKYKEEREMHI
jgi:hypothetical protein